MKNLFKFKKLSTQIAFIVTASVVIIGGIAVIYMQSRIVEEIENNSRLIVRYNLIEAAEVLDIDFAEAANKVRSMRNIAETYFSPELYMADPHNYFNNSLRLVLDDFIHSVVRDNFSISAAYFAVDPDLAGFPLVNEIFFEEDGGIIVAQEPQTYEEYMQTDAEDMAWFYAAFLSSKPHWTDIYLWDGDENILYISYIEPVIIDGVTVGVVGIDISISHLEQLVYEMQIYETGFAAIKDNSGNFVEAAGFIENLSADEKDRLYRLATENNGEAFDIGLGGVNFIVAHRELFNGYSLFVFAPRGEAMAEVTESFIRFAIIFVVVVALVVIISYFIGKKMAKPLAALSEFMRRAGTTGDISLSREEEQRFNIFIEKGGEIAQLINNCVVYFSHISAAAQKLETIAGGDLSIEVERLSEKDIIAVSLNEMVENLNNLFAEIRSSAEQVSDASKQIAEGAASLSNGSSQQNAAIDELSTSIVTIREQTGENASFARDAADMSNAIRESAEKGNVQMDSMMQAVAEINEASSKISKVIKVIDEIAFQTNILALNAAVEAARAGQHGKGFAVVAEEVRNLAAKSAASAKDTGELIDNTVEKANLGMSIATETAESLKEIVEGINRNAEVISRIANESDEQLVSIDKLSSGIVQISQVTQQTSATAQQKAAASQEMNKQSDMLEQLVSQFKLKDEDQNNIKYLVV